MLAVTPVLKAIETKHQPDAASLYTRLQAVRCSKCILVITVERYLHGRLFLHVIIRRRIREIFQRIDDADDNEEGRLENAGR